LEVDVFNRIIFAQTNLKNPEKTYTAQAAPIILPAAPALR
jgi:hypothetical protein